MRRLALAVSFLIAGCAEGDSGVINVPVFDSAVVDTGAVDSTIPEVATDSAVDTAMGEDAVTDSGVDTTMPDTAMPDTELPDTFVADTGPVDAGPPYTHTIAIDGTNDFAVVQEKFATTSSGYDAYVTWDDANIYVAYAGADIGSSASVTKWLFVYLDVDPGMATGAVVTERYNTQTLRFPTGFGAEYYARYRTDNAEFLLKSWDGSSWSIAPNTMTKAKLAAFVEIRIPRANVGGGKTFGLVTHMINEGSSVESTYAGLFAGNFTDGYSPSSAPKPLTKYLLIDTGAAAPSASSRIKP